MSARQNAQGGAPSRRETRGSGRRWPPSRVVVALVAFALLAFTGCSSGARPTTDAGAAGNAPTGTLVMIIRR